MKTLLLTSLVAAAVSSGFAQGAIDVGNNFGATVFRAPIYGPELANPSSSKVGQSSQGAPTGTTVYTGPRLQGTGFTFGFYASTTGITADPAALSLVGTLQFGTTAGTAGFVPTTTLNIPGVLAGNPTTWQIRVWDNGGGTLGYAEASYRGQSPLVNSGPLGGVSPGGPVLNPNTASGWTSFNIYLVSEPSVFALAALGAITLFFIRRR